MGDFYNGLIKSIVGSEQEGEFNPTEYYGFAAGTGLQLLTGVCLLPTVPLAGLALIANAVSDGFSEESLIAKLKNTN
jgi:hypothetical protein